MGKSTGMPRGVEVNGTKLRIVFQYQGKRRREQLELEVSPANIKAASRMREKIVDEIASGIFEYGKHFEGKGAITGTTFRQLAEVWLASRKAELADTSYRKYDQNLKKFWLPKLGDRVLAKLKPSEVVKVVSDIDWEPYSAKLRNDALISLRGVFQMALDDDLIQVDPLARVRNKKPRPRAANPFSLDEVQAILAEIDESIRYAYELLFFTGMRPGELIELKWSDLNGGSLAIARNKILGKVNDTKTHKPRDHELADRLVALLGSRPKPRTGHIVRDPRTGEAFKDYSDLRERWWTDALKAANLPYRELYQTRHTYATLAILAGANPYWIAQQMGTSPELIFKVYAKWLRGHSDGNLVNALIAP